ncbi:hypothetical protein K6V92_10320 [Cupriavidus respiraculi]|uniref:hypothetical protein n=1 Tax=Cupriavidus respiraculi TaxID=195930 RepID=UPI001C974D6C|nr:hypothetical protein [Cupriavidus respiraculi]MBY4947012.1 hypothetical protein [Cupriavidus respiraculi]
MATKKRKVETEETVICCGNCRYVKPAAGATECRRNPPVPVLDMSDGGVMTVFPLVSDAEWCGCWAPKLNS